MNKIFSSHLCPAAMAGREYSLPMSQWPLHWWFIFLSSTDLEQCKALFVHQLYHHVQAGLSLEALPWFPRDESLKILNFQLRRKQYWSASGLGISVLRKSTSFCAIRREDEYSHPGLAMNHLMKLHCYPKQTLCTCSPLFYYHRTDSKRRQGFFSLSFNTRLSVVELFCFPLALTVF